MQRAGEHAELVPAAAGYQTDVPTTTTDVRRLAVAARWPVGVLATSWAYMWRTVPLHRRERAGSLQLDGPPPLPAGVDRDGLQGPLAGTGPLFHRRYRVRVREARLGAADLIEQVREDPNRVAPGALAHFLKTTGEDGPLRPGDEFVVRMPGPWDGPVRVLDADEHGFRFATMDGHLEAGQIAWRARDEEDGLVFEIESWARPGDRLSALMHHRLRMAKEVQLHMWTSVCERVARRAGGAIDGGIDIETRVVELDD
jgi:hypothetical protein